MYVSPEKLALISPVLEIIAHTFVLSLEPSAASIPFMLISPIASISTP